MAKDLINLDNARTDDQRKVMEKILKAGECPFCTENLKKYHKQPVLKENKHWVMTRNQWPYKHTKLHYIAIAKKHSERLADLSSEQVAALFDLFREVEQEKKLPFGSVAMRFGDTGKTGASVRHLHAHLIVADKDDPGYQPVKFKVG